MQRRGTSGSEHETKEKKSSIDHQKETTEAPSSSRPHLPRNPQPTVDSFVTTKGLRAGKSTEPFVSTKREDYCKNYAFDYDGEPSNKGSETSHFYENPLSELQGSPTDPMSTSSSLDSKLTKSKSSPAKVSASGASPKSTKSSRNPEMSTDSSSQASYVTVLECSVPLPSTSSLQSTKTPTSSEAVMRRAFASYNLDIADEYKYKKADKHVYTNPLANMPDPPTGQSLVKEVKPEGKDTPISSQGADRYKEDSKGN